MCVTLFIYVILLPYINKKKIIITQIYLPSDTQIVISSSKLNYVLQHKIHSSV